MDLNRLGPGLLHAFLVVAEAGKISEAARRLHLSQPAVTAQIRRLEADLDMPLFIRSVHGVTLTPRGAHLRERLQHIFADLEEALSDLDRPGEVTGILKFAASTTSAAHFVPNIFARFRRTTHRPRECNHPSPWPRRSRLDKSRHPPPPHRRRTVPPGSDIKSLPLS